MGLKKKKNPKWVRVLVIPPDPYTYNIKKKKKLKPYYPNINTFFHSFRLIFLNSQPPPLSLSQALKISATLSLFLSSSHRQPPSQPQMLLSQPCSASRPSPRSAPWSHIASPPFTSHLNPLSFSLSFSLNRPSPSHRGARISWWLLFVKKEYGIVRSNLREMRLSKDRIMFSVCDLCLFFFSKKLY